MGNNGTINEIYWLRALACTAVVIVHAVNTTLANYEFTMSVAEEYFLIALRFMAFFGTPAFIFISEFLLSYSYRNGVPKGFFIKRVKFLLVPFAFMGIVFAFIKTGTSTAFFEQLLLNLFLGGYTGYFVLIIFQFYILHVAARRVLEKWSPLKVIITAFIINAVYLGFFHMTEPPAIMLGEYFWERGHWLPVFGWVFYFVLGYYSGRHYNEVLQFLRVAGKSVHIAAPLMLVLIFISVRLDILTVVSSKRVDYLFYTMTVIGLIMLATHRLKRVPVPILFISKYSFNIYLLHTFFLFYMPPVPGLNPVVYFAGVVVLSMGASVLTVRLASIYKITPYLIGKTLKIPDQSAKAG